MSAASLTDLLEAAAAWLCFVDERESVSRAQLLALASEALDAPPEREEGLRASGTLLREGRIAAVAGGRYRVSEGSRFHPARLAG
jgi:pilus assembly protein FimV